MISTVVYSLSPMISQPEHLFKFVYVFHSLTSVIGLVDACAALHCRLTTELLCLQLAADMTLYHGGQLPILVFVTSSDII